MFDLEEARRRGWIETPIEQVHAAQQAALMRLQLWFTGETHRLLSEVAAAASAQILRLGARDEPVDGLAGYRMIDAVGQLYQGQFSHAWLQILQGVRQEAAAIPFGALAVYHRWMAGQAAKLAEPAAVREAITAEPGVFATQLRLIVEAANGRIYGDGLTLSSRLWRLEQEARAGINRVILQAISSRQSAWEAAKALEAYLGASADCPRWTATRLYRLSKTAIAAGDRRGLKTGAECAGQGVAYNALRLARTEIQAVHHLASDRVMAALPMVEKEQIHLSPAHPATGCDCEAIVAGGEGGQGIYPKGTISLPVHPHCLCYKTAVMMAADQFTDQLRGWLRGEQPWAAMDAYAELIGLPIGGGPFDWIDLEDDPISASLGVWLFGEAKALAGRIG